MFAEKPNEKAEIPILLDIPRTYPDHPRFGVNGTDVNMVRKLICLFLIRLVVQRSESLRKLQPFYRLYTRFAPSLHFFG